MWTILLLGILGTSFRITVQKPTVQVEKFDLAIDEKITFTTPNYENGSYPYNSNNFWEFHSLSTKQLQLHFESFDVEEHQNCAWDKVKISKGRCNDLPDITDKPDILCGDQTGNRFYCDASFMCVTFHSDGVINRPGFNATVWAKPDLTVSSSTETGSMTSKWSFQSTSPTTSSVSSSSSSLSTSSNSVTSFSSSQSSSTPSPSLPLTTISQLSTQTSSLSSSQKMSSSPVLSETSWSPPSSKASSPPSPAISSPIVSAPSSTTKTILSSTSTQSLPKSSSPNTSNKFTTMSVLHSSPIITSLKASSEYSTVSVTELNPNKSSSVKTTALQATVTSSPTETSLLEIIMCQPVHRNLEFSNMEAISIRTPMDDTGKKYPVNRNCTVTINNVENKTLQIDFESFKLEYNYFCAWDFLEVSILGEETKKYCGGTLPELIKTNSQVINLVFHSDHIVPDEGFVLHVFQIDLTVSNPTETKSVTSKLPSQSTSPTTSSVSSSSPSLSTSSNSVTSFSSSQPSSTPSPSLPLTTMLPLSTQTSSLSSSEKMSSSETPSETSWSPPSSKASSPPSPAISSPIVSASSSTTKSILSSTSTQSLPKSSSPNTSNKFTTMSVLHSSPIITSLKASSKYSSVSVTELNPNKSSSVKTTAPQTIATSSATETSLLEIIMCQPIHRNLEFSNMEAISIRTPMDESGKKYPVNRHCTVTINNVENKTLQIDFESFKLEYNYFCAWDFLEVSILGEETKKYCGGTLPELIKTCSQVINLVFHSDHIVPDEGFVLHVFQIDLTVSNPTETRSVTSKLPSQSTSPTTSSVSSSSSSPSLSTSSNSVTSFSSSQSSSTPSPSLPLTTMLPLSTQTSSLSSSEKMSSSSVLSETSWSPPSSKASSPPSPAISSPIVSASSSTTKSILSSTSTQSLPKSSSPNTSNKFTTMSVLHSSPIITSHKASSEYSTVSVTELNPNKSSSVKTTAPQTTTTSSVIEASMLEIIMCQPVHHNVNFSNMEAISIRTPMDESGKKYPVNRHCTVTINNVENETLQVDFESFKLEYNYFCAWDFLEVSILGEETKKYCGGTLPELIKTNSLVINLVFHSDHIVPDEGFVLHVFQIDAPTTNVTVTNDNQQKSNITPPLPSSTTSPPSSSLTTNPPPSISTSSLSLSSSTSSTPLSSSTSSPSSSSSSSISSKHSTTKSNLNTKDSTVSYSTGNATSTDNGNETTSTSAANNVTPTSFNPTTKVNYSTDVFHTVTTSNTNNEYNPTTASTKQPTTSYKSEDTTKHNDSDVVDVCKQSSKFVDRPLYLVSPNFDQIYPPNSRCTMSLTAINDIMLIVDMFDVETHSKCEWDHVELEYNTSKIKFCGELVLTDQPTPYSSCNPNKLNVYDVINYHNVCLFQSGTSIRLKPGVIKLSFVSDYIVNKKGFKISVLPIKSDHDTKAPETSSTQSTTGGSSTGTTASDAISSLQTGMSSSGSSPSLSKATDVSTKSTSTTSFTQEGLSSTADFISTSSSKQDNMQSDLTQAQSSPSAESYSTTHLHETVTSDTISSNPTVESSVTVVSNDTSSDLNTNASGQSNTEVTPPVVPETEPMPVTSHPTLKHSSTKLATVTPTRDKTSTTSVPTSITETTPKLTTETVQEEPTTDACSGTMIMDGETGYIESPGYHSNKYPKDSTCRWKITGGEKPKLIMIVFEFFDVEYSPRCLWDKVAIYEIQAGDDTLKEVWYKCGNALPTLLSFKKDILIEFTSDSITEMAGFRLKYFKIETSIDRTYTCNTAGMMPCLNETKCIPSEWWCDGMVDCMEDQTDESSCELCGEDEIQCVNGTCISAAFRCDGKEDCPYGTDERSCVSIPEEDEVSPVYVNVQNKWLPLCTDDNVSNRSDDICNAAGYRSSSEVQEYKGHVSDSYSKVDSDSDTLMFTTSSTCEVNKTVHLRCRGSECGVKGTALRRKRIIGGELSGIWPWSVALRLGNNVLCGGSIISSEWVVTAGHCVYDSKDNPQIVSIIAGVNDVTDENKQIRYVSEVVNHPDYDDIFEADISLLRLQSPLTFSHNVQPICLPWDRRQFTPLDICYVVGYGVSDMRNYHTTVAPRYLRQGKTKIIDREACKKLYSHKKDPIKNSMICAGYAAGGVDACKGDSGGGLMCLNENGRWMLAGVISWGEKCGSTNRPGVYTNMVSFMDWLDKKTKPDGHHSVTCNFETDWCGYRDISVGNYIWTRKPGDKYVKGTVLFAAKTSAPNQDKAINASLLSPTFTLISDSCLSLRIMFSLNSNIAVTIYGKESGEPEEYPDKVLFRVFSDYPNKDVWNSVEINIPGNITQLMIVSHNDYGSVSGFGLDNVTMVTGTCQGSNFLECDFDNADLCQYTQSNDTNTVYWAIDPSTEFDGNHLITGGDGWDDSGLSAVSQLISPSVSKKISAISHCLTFSYFKHTLSDPNTDLFVSTYIRVNIGLVDELANQQIYWSSQGLGTGQWLTERITVPHHSFDHLVFEVCRKSYSDDMVEILLDDIRFTDGTCV